MVDKGIGYISLTTFTRDAGRNVANALRDLKTESADLNGVILDLRGNGGGLLREAINVCNVFIPADETVVTTRSKVVEEDKSYKTRNEPVDQNIKLVVLIDDNSASASEIVSGVMQDLDRGVIMGQLSYGKGLVQNTFDIGYNAKVKLTTSKYYIPSGRCIQSVEYKNGERVHIPDDQRAKFQTRAGRTVLDGGGVKPDIHLDAEKDPLIVKKLSKQYAIFNFVTSYCIGLDSIGPMEDYHFKDFEAFTKYLKESDFNYVTETDDVLNTLKEVAEKEAYSEEVDKEVEHLIATVDKEKANQINSHMKEIILAIEKEIISRYYYETGLVKYQLKNDPELIAAIKVLNNDKEYKSILSVN
jgi:carboxyl-terminal processing protease